MNNIISSFITCALIACLSACGGHGSEEEVANPGLEDPSSDPIANLAPLPPPTTLDCPQGTRLTYRNFGKAFFSNYCTSCHSQNLPAGQRGDAPLHINLDSVDDIHVWLGSILKDSIDTKTNKASMPPSQTTSETEQAMLSEWLNCGAPK